MESNNENDMHNSDDDATSSSSSSSSFEAAVQALYSPLHQARTKEALARSAARRTKT
eukprot:CAMPEP_0194056844 /NCGR_PEP_ID=MMETSP0009_2-20130614/61484_1 /TAXON_ID=210454 /ORGANISM="Grammatophora oceanica, Strain CCMP 410" /LENGTH=56 /DNA_ID=CAMNT_0038706367 /DNA_START=122 /DNA_END=288 /DNA_ORIENTATION=+